MWTYAQVSGLLEHVNAVMGIGYSGKGACKNLPSAQFRHNLGPIPCGLYTIGDPVDTNAHGPFVLPLTPHADNNMQGRAGFLIHGDSIAYPGEASQGCIILSRPTREKMAASEDRLLEVISGFGAKTVPDPPPAVKRQG